MSEMEGARTGLQYRVVEPSVGSTPHPAIVLLHGRGSNELDLLSLGPELDPRLMVISPRAPYEFGPGSYFWYDLEAAMIGRPTPEQLETSLDLVVELLDEVGAKYPVDTNRLFVGGFSMGGAMTAALLLMHPTRLAGAMILSGYVPIHSTLPWDLDNARDKPVFQGHGTYDNVLPIQFGRMSRDFLGQAGLDLTYREYPMAHQVSAPELADAAAWIRALM